MKNKTQNDAYNMNMSAEEIRKFKELIKETKEFEINKKIQNLSNNFQNNNDSLENLDKQKALEILYSKTNGLETETTEKKTNGLDFNYLSTNLKKLEELRKSGLINDQEYQQLKLTLIK